MREGNNIEVVDNAHTLGATVLRNVEDENVGREEKEELAEKGRRLYGLLSGAKTMFPGCLFTRPE